MSELPVDPAAPPAMAVNTANQWTPQGETSMELDEEPEDPHGYLHSGFLNPLALPEPKGNPSSCFPNCLEWSPTWKSDLRESHPGNSPDQHRPSTLVETSHCPVGQWPQ